MVLFPPQAAGNFRVISKTGRALGQSLLFIVDFIETIFAHLVIERLARNT